jgi:hypothetical protein
MTVVSEVNGLLGLQVVIAVVLPAVVGLVTTRLTDPKWKSLLLLTLTAVSSVAQELAVAVQRHTEFRVFDVLMVAGASYVLSIAVHTGIMKPTGLAGKLADAGVAADPRLVAVKDAGWAGELPEAEQVVDFPAPASKHRAE